MKKHLFFGAICAAVLTAATFVACNSEDNPAIPSEKSVDDFGKVLIAIDGLNREFGFMSSRGNSDNDLQADRDSADIVQFCDFAGMLAGNAASASLSGAVSIPASPLAGIALEVLISAAMSELGSQLFSAVSSLCVGYQIVTNKNHNNDFKCIFDNNIELLSSECDIPIILNSVGERHNLFMVKTHRKYRHLTSAQIQQSNTISLILEDCITDLKNTYKDYGELEISPKFKKHLILVISDLMSMAKTSLSQPNGFDSFSQKAQALLINKYAYNKEKVYSFTNLQTLITDGCRNLDNKTVGEYSTKLGETINNSNLSTLEKSNVANCAQISINSRLCWAEN